jgi:hypothetical protein
MGDDKRKAKITTIAMLAIICGMLIGNHYLFINHKYTYFETETTRWLLPVIVFMVGVMARASMNILLAQKLEISSEIFSYFGSPYVLLSNMRYGEMIDVKVSFELMSYQKRDKKGLLAV